MKDFIILWRSFAICYAIGYVLFIKPIIPVSIITYVNIIFYLSLIVFSYLNYRTLKKT
ncbi:MAG: hypothetical protein ACI9AR_000141 [Flavobacteriaceae bacterium]|jgi:uncharacterized protein YqgC (DUF456 family)